MKNLQIDQFLNSVCRMTENNSAIQGETYESNDVSDIF